MQLYHVDRDMVYEACTATKNNIVGPTWDTRGRLYRRYYLGDTQCACSQICHTAGLHMVWAAHNIIPDAIGRDFVQIPPGIN